MSGLECSLWRLYYRSAEVIRQSAPMRTHEVENTDQWFVLLLLLGNEWNNRWELGESTKKSKLSKRSRLKPFPVTVPVYV